MNQHETCRNTLDGRTPLIRKTTKNCNWKNPCRSWMAQDSPNLLVVDVISESPAEKQGVRAGSRLAKINGMHVEPWRWGKFLLGKKCELTTKGTRFPAFFRKQWWPGMVSWIGLAFLVDANFLGFSVGLGNTARLKWQWNLNGLEQMWWEITCYESYVLFISNLNEVFGFMFALLIKGSEIQSMTPNSTNKWQVYSMHNTH